MAAQHHMINELLIRIFFYENVLCLSDGEVKMYVRISNQKINKKSLVLTLTEVS